MNKDLTDAEVPDNKRSEEIAEEEETGEEPLVSSEEKGADHCHSGERDTDDGEEAAKRRKCRWSASCILKM